MCAGCPGGRAVSKLMAYINLHGMKQAVLAELRRSVGRRARISVLGDQWVLGTRTGSQQVLPDVEALADALVRKHLVEPRVLPDDGGADLEWVIEGRAHHGAVPLDAGRLVRAMLIRAAGG